MSLNIESFKTIEAQPGATLKLFNRYVERMELMFQLIFRKADGTPYEPSDAEKKAMLLFKGGDDMKNLFQYVGKVDDGDAFRATVEKIQKGLGDRTNKVVQRNMLLTDFPQGSKSFEKWSQDVANAAQLISYENYDWKQATVDAILLQTSSPKLRERALQENTSYDALMTMGVRKEQSARGAALLEQASGSTSHSKVKVEEEVRRLQHENQRLRSHFNKTTEKTCARCGRGSCKQGSRCIANGQKCHKCGLENHFSKMCRSSTSTSRRSKQDADGAKTQRKSKKTRKKSSFGQLSSAEESDSEESSGRIVVGHLSAKSIGAKVGITGVLAPKQQKEILLATDTGISKTLLNRCDWEEIKSSCTFIKTSKRFRPYGTAYHLPIKGKAKVKLTAERGATIDTWVYVVDDKKEQSLLGEGDAIRLGIVKLDLKGAAEETVQKIEYGRKSRVSSDEVISGGETQAEIDESMKKIVDDFPEVFSDVTGKFRGPPIKIQVHKNAVPVIQPGRRIPLHYMDRLKSELKRMEEEDIIEGPIDLEEPGTFISNLVITDKNDTDRIRITLDCQAVNKVIYPTHEPIPTSDELRHNLLGSDRFSNVDMTNCYHQFEIEENARKLYAFRTPWGIFRYKRMVMGTSPASSEVQKRIRSIIHRMPNAIHIKDDIMVHGVGKEHDVHLRNVLDTLQKHGVTVRPDKCHLGQPEVKWFGQIYSKFGVSPDPEKCKVIKEWPAPKSTSEVKSFLQTVQFNAKFMGGEPGQKSYPELTEPLRAMTKKYARFRWGKKEEEAFTEMKERLCSDKVLAPYDLSKNTRLYVDSSPVGTQATVCQLHVINDEYHWRPVNHTSRPWTPAEAGYGQIERESNGICTGMYMNKMYTLGTHLEVVTDHEPLIPVYNSPSKPKQLRVDRHRTKLLPFSYNVVYEPGSKTPCDYGSRHPPKSRAFSTEEIEDWCIETGTDIFVNRVIEDSLPIAITLNMVRSETASDKDLQLLEKYIITHDKRSCQMNLRDYHEIFNDLTVIDGVIMKGNQIIVPESLRAEVIGLAHEGHQYAEKTLSLIRQSCWFPRMRKDVLDYVESCVACLAAIPRVTPVPLQPNMLPERAWQNLHADFKGPIGGSFYLHVVIDQFSKYPEVDIMSSTSFKKLRPKLDRIFSGHGIPETVTADNGPPYPSHEMERYAEEMGFTMTLVTPEDPQSNGFAEIFVKILCKMLHTAVAEGKDPKVELHKYLLHYRATPHPTTGLSPAEMLFNRKIRTKLPQWFPTQESPQIGKARETHDAKKLVQKQQFDRRRNAKEREVNPGDLILIRQQKTTTKPPFDPEPYKVTGVDGNRVNAVRGEKVRQRDKNAIKIVRKRPDHLLPSWERNQRSKLPITNYENLEIEGKWPTLHTQVEIVHVQSLVQVEVEAIQPDSDTLQPAGDTVGAIGENSDILIENHGNGNYHTMQAPVLRKGDLVLFKWKEWDDEWLQCKLLSRAGKAKGRYSLAWNILRDGCNEYIDFEREDVEYKLLHSQTEEPIVRDADGASIVGDPDGESIVGDADGEAIVGDADRELIVGDADGEATTTNSDTSRIEDDMEAHLRRLLEAAEIREHEKAENK